MPTRFGESFSRVVFWLAYLIHLLSTQWHCLSEVPVKKGNKKNLEGVGGPVSDAAAAEVF